MGLMFNKIHYEARGESYLGAYYAKLGINGAVGPLREVGGAGPEYSDLLTLTNGDLLLGGSQGALISFDSGGAPRWKKSFRQPLLVNPSSANLSDGNICVSAWMLGSKGELNKLRIMQLDQRGETRHVADIDALRGQVAGGPQASCAVLYDRAPSVYNGEYHLTVFDHSLGRQWTVPVPQTSASGAEFTLVRLVEGYLAQIRNTLIEFDWSGKELWTETENRGLVRTIVVPAKDGFFVVTNDLNMNNGFHVKRVLTTRP